MGVNKCQPANQKTYFWKEYSLRQSKAGTFSVVSFPGCMALPLCSHFRGLWAQFTDRPSGVIEAMQSNAGKSASHELKPSDDNWADQGSSSALETRLATPHLPGAGSQPHPLSPYRIRGYCSVWLTTARRRLQLQYAFCGGWDAQSFFRQAAMFSSAVFFLLPFRKKNNLHPFSISKKRAPSFHLLSDRMPG